MCDHDLGERETACAMDGLCPICMVNDIKELERQLKSTNQIRKAEKEILIKEIEKNKELEEVIKKVLLWRNLDGDGISDPLRKELYKLVWRESK